MSKNNMSNMSFDDEAMQQMFKDFELANANGQPQVMPTRASVKRQFTDLDSENLLEIAKTMEQLDEKLGSTSTIIRSLSQEGIDNLVEELLVVRKFNDILSSREETLKTFAKKIIGLNQLEPDITNGELVSPKNKVKISKEIRGGKLEIDIDLLKNTLEPQQFDSVTDEVVTTVVRYTPDGKSTKGITTTREVNEKCLEQEMVKGNILSEDVFLSSKESKRTSAIYIRELEN